MKTKFVFINIVKNTKGGSTKDPEEKGKRYKSRESLAHKRMLDFFEDVPLRLESVKLPECCVCAYEGSLLHLNLEAISTYVEV